MIRNFFLRLRHFSGDTRGSAVIEFAIMFPIFLTMFLSGIEMSMATVRQTMLERALNESVRQLRIGTTGAPQYAELRKMICDYSRVLPDCENAIKLEMINVDLRDYSALDPDPDCVNRAEVVNPIRVFQSGQRNQMMVLRVCYQFAPIFPNIGLGTSKKKDSNGDMTLIAVTAFVNEPS